MLKEDVLYSITGLIGVLYYKFNQRPIEIPTQLIPELKAFFAKFLDITSISEIVATMIEYNYPEHLSIYYFLLFLASVLSLLCDKMEDSDQEDEREKLETLIDCIMFQMWTIFYYNLKLGTILFMV